MKATQPRKTTPVHLRVFRRCIVEANGCLTWTGALVRGGYGTTQAIYDGRRRNISTHRAVYIAVVGPVPEGLQLDHLCRNRACCNPAHLEPVTAWENTMRSTSFAAVNAAKTHCVNGHPFEGDNLRYGPHGKSGVKRYCRACVRARDAARRTRLRTQKNPT